MAIVDLTEIYEATYMVPGKHYYCEEGTKLSELPETILPMLKNYNADTFENPRDFYSDRVASVNNQTFRSYVEKVTSLPRCGYQIHFIDEKYFWVICRFYKKEMGYFKEASPGFVLPDMESTVDDCLPSWLKDVYHVTDGIYQDDAFVSGNLNEVSCVLRRLDGSDLDYDASIDGSLFYPFHDLWNGDFLSCGPEGKVYYHDHEKGNIPVREMDGTEWADMYFSKLKRIRSVSKVLDKIERKMIRFNYM